MKKHAVLLKYIAQVCEDPIPGMSCGLLPTSACEQQQTAHRRPFSLWTGRRFFSHS